LTFLDLIRKNLRYHRKAWLGILAGTLISTAVITGALVVGDSVRYSLGRICATRLGTVKLALKSDGRFFRQQLADDLSRYLPQKAVPVLALEGFATNPEGGKSIGRVQILGIDERFTTMWEPTGQQPEKDVAVLSSNTAEGLGLKVGDEFLLKVQQASPAPNDAPFVSERNPLAALRLRVLAIAPGQGMGRFSLKSNQSAPFTVFVNLKELSALSGSPGRANMLLIPEGKSSSLSPSDADSLLRQVWQAADAGLSIRKLSAGNTFEIRSDRVFLDSLTSKAIVCSVPGATPVLTYLVNSLLANGRSTPYSFVTAADSGISSLPLSGNEVAVNQWLADDLGLKTGDPLVMQYFRMGPMRKLIIDSTTLRVTSIRPLSDPVFDSTLMPDFPGMTDAGNCRDWETGAPIDLKKIRDKDEQYWKEHRGTPKAFLSFATGRTCWNNSFGAATAFRFKATQEQIPTLEQNLMQAMKPAANGLIFRDVAAEGGVAAAQSTDFGSLFLSLSFFILAAALLLTALLFSLHARQRMAETAVLSALGFKRSTLLYLLATEAALVLLAGGIAGSLAGIGYNHLILFGLNTLWQDAVRTSVLETRVLPATLLTGFLGGTLSATAVLMFVLIRNLRNPLAVLVRDTVSVSPESGEKGKRFRLILTALFLIPALLIPLAGRMAGSSDPSALAMISGALGLAGLISAFNGMLHHQGSMRQNPLPGFGSLLLRNLSLRKNRNLAAMALLAAGTFTVIITGANHKSPDQTMPARESGTGGYLLWAEMSVPVFADLNTAEGKEKTGLSGEPLLDSVSFMQMLRLDGNDASCLNLNQVSAPVILGVDAAAFDRRSSFHFTETDPATDPNHPWLALRGSLAPEIIPGYADATVITWGLRKKLGDTLFYRDESGNRFGIKLNGALENSVFQGNILISSENFRKFFPSSGKPDLMLIDAPFQQKQAVNDRLTYLLSEYGLQLTPCVQRLEEFNSVENTYLAVFMLLGGLGMLLGTVGLGIVIMRNLSERRAEVALYRAVGFRQEYILKLLLAENLILLLAGLGSGILAAFVALLPALWSQGFHHTGMLLPLLIALMFVNGLLWIYIPVKRLLSTGLLSALRKE
jgi:putative ABC transport system permease protein